MALRHTVTQGQTNMGQQFNYSSINHDTVWVEVTQDDIVYRGYVMEENEMLGEPTVRLFVIESTGSYSGFSTFLKKSEITIRVLPGVTSISDLRNYKEIKWHN